MSNVWKAQWFPNPGDRELSLGRTHYDKLTEGTLIALHFDSRFNKNSRFQCYFLAFLTTWISLLRSWVAYLALCLKSALNTRYNVINHYLISKVYLKDGCQLFKNSKKKNKRKIFNFSYIADFWNNYWLDISIFIIGQNTKVIKLIKLFKLIYQCSQKCSLGLLVKSIFDKINFIFERGKLIRRQNVKTTSIQRRSNVGCWMGF